MLWGGPRIVGTRTAPKTSSWSWMLAGAGHPNHRAGAHPGRSCRPRLHEKWSGATPPLRSGRYRAFSTANIAAEIEDHERERVGLTSQSCASAAGRDRLRRVRGGSPPQPGRLLYGVAMSRTPLRDGSPSARRAEQARQEIQRARACFLTLVSRLRGSNPISRCLPRFALTPQKGQAWGPPLLRALAIPMEPRAVRLGEAHEGDNARRIEIFRWRPHRSKVMCAGPMGLHPLPSVVKALRVEVKIQRRATRFLGGREQSRG